MPRLHLKRPLHLCRGSSLRKIPSKFPLFVAVSSLRLRFRKGPLLPVPMCPRRVRWPTRHGDRRGTQVQRAGLRPLGAQVPRAHRVDIVVSLSTRALTGMTIGVFVQLLLA